MFYSSDEIEYTIDINQTTNIVKKMGSGTGK